MKTPTTKKKVYWLGFSDGRPFVERTVDTYVGDNEKPPQTLVLFYSKKEAKKRFEDFRQVRLTPLPKKRPL